MKTNIVLIGLMGCGKTTVGKLLAEKLCMQFIDMDEYIEEQFGSIKSLFEKGEAIFRDAESKAVIDLSIKDGFIISTGGGVVLRSTNMEALKEKGLVIYLDRPIEEILKTVETDSRPLLKDGADVLYKIHTEREPLYRKFCDYVIDASSLDKTVQAITGIWSNKGL